MNHNFLIVFAKEVVDALRDRRTLLRTLLPALLMGPIILVALSQLIASIETRAERREIVVAGMEYAPTLRNYLERQTYTVKTAPAGYEQALRSAKLLDPVLHIPADFEAQLRAGEQPTLELVSDSANQRAESAVPGLQRLLMGFNRERAGLNLALRGVAPALLQPVLVEERDLASVQARASRITAMLPMLIVMAMLLGALTAALDSTAGERERGSLEPLLMNPVQPLALALGKWGAVALLGMAVAVLSSLSFIPAQWLLQSDSLKAQFQYGAYEALLFVLVMLPLAAGLSGVIMAMAIRTKSFKEAQASTGLLTTAVSLLPMISLFNPGGEAAWYFWVPGLAQNTLMMLVLKGEALSAAQLLPGILTGALLATASLVFVARAMRGAVAK